MKTDLNTLKKELSRLTDVNYLKKEINRIAEEIKKFDVQAHLTPKANARIEHLEKRFRKALASLRDLQTQVDSNLERFVDIVRRRKKNQSKVRSSKKSARKKVSNKKPTRSAAKKSSR